MQQQRSTTLLQQRAAAFAMASEVACIFTSSRHGGRFSAVATKFPKPIPSFRREIICLPFGWATFCRENCLKPIPSFRGEIICLPYGWATFCREILSGHVIFIQIFRPKKTLYRNNKWGEFDLRVKRKQSHVFWMKSMKIPNDYPSCKNKLYKQRNNFTALGFVKWNDFTHT